MEARNKAQNPNSESSVYNVMKISDVRKKMSCHSMAFKFAGVDGVILCTVRNRFLHPLVPGSLNF